MLISVGSAAVAVCASGCFGWGLSVSGERPLNVILVLEKGLMAAIETGFEACTRDKARIELLGVKGERAQRVERRVSLRRLLRAIEVRKQKDGDWGSRR
jgi:hypothetical protein